MPITIKSKQSAVPEHIQELIKQARKERTPDQMYSYLIGLSKVSKDSNEIVELKRMADDARKQSTQN